MFLGSILLLPLPNPSSPIYTCLLSHHRLSVLILPTLLTILQLPLPPLPFFSVKSKDPYTLLSFTGPALYCYLGSYTYLTDSCSPMDHSLLAPTMSDNDVEDQQVDGSGEARGRRKRPRVIEWDERDRLLSPSSCGGGGGGNARSSYVHHDDPAVSRNFFLNIQHWLASFPHVSAPNNNGNYNYCITC